MDGSEKMRESLRTTWWLGRDAESRAASINDGFTAGIGEAAGIGCRIRPSAVSAGIGEGGAGISCRIRPSAVSADIGEGGAGISCRIRPSAVSALG
jgi:hypothetical protein